jgi:hypothetical protein
LADTQIISLAQAFLTCLCDAVALNPNPPEHCCFRVGSEVPHDMGFTIDQCCQGIAYVSLGDVWPSTSGFPNTDTTEQANSVCSPPSWGIQLRAGIIRCLPTSDPVGNPITCTEWTAGFVQQAHDSQALRRATCCFRNFIRNSQEFLGMSVVIERQSATNPSGGCIERFQPVSVQMLNCDC